MGQVHVQRGLQARLVDVDVRPQVAGDLGKMGERGARRGGDALRGIPGG